MKKYVLLISCLFCFCNLASQIVKEKRTDIDIYLNPVKYGFVDINEKWVVEPKYDFAMWDGKWGYGIIKLNDKQGLVDSKGNVVIQCLYKNVFVNDPKYATIVDFNDKQGVFSFDEKRVIIPCEYSGAYVNDAGNGNYITVFDSGKLKGLYSVNQHKMILACIYKNVWINMRDKYISITDSNDRKGIVSLTGDVIIPCEYKELQTDNLIYRLGYWIITDFNDLKGMYSTAEGKVILPCKYKDIHDAETFEDGYLRVTGANGKEGVIDSKGKKVVECEYAEVNNIKGWVTFSVKSSDGKYGAVNGGKLVVPCQYEEVKCAADGVFLVKQFGKWGYYANGYEIIPCKYDNATEFTNGVAQVTLDGQVSLIKNPTDSSSDVEIASYETGTNKKTKGPAVSRYPAPNSDVDKDIPVAKKKSETVFAFIIANENYPDAPVPYSLNDGRMFREYCLKTLGLPEENISLYEDATFGNIIAAVEKMRNIADAYDGDASVIFYYAGHGFPDDKQSTAYLLPVDGNASDITITGYSLAKLYKDIAAMNLKTAVVFLDACFSGAKREDTMLASSRGIAIKVKEEAPQGNMVVFSAAQGDETAHQLEDKGHGLFTYFLLKELQQTAGDVSLGDLTDFVTKQVKRQSVVINNKKQTPTVIPSSEVFSSWRDLRLK